MVSQDRLNGERGEAVCPLTGDIPDYVIGNLAPADGAAIERHLADGCRACEREREQTARLVAEVDLALVTRDPAPADGPPAELRARLLERVASERRSEADAGAVAASAAESPAPEADVQVWRKWERNPGAEPLPGLLTVAPDDGDWEPIGVPGIRVRQLFVDHDRDLVTMLVRMDAGATYPPHRHADVEECYVVAGDLQVAGESLGPGAYQRAASGSVHVEQSTRAGCTLLIVSSTQDELLAS